MPAAPRPVHKTRAPAAFKAPVLTLPEAEANLVRELYASAPVILEYGSGGSTMLAASLPGKTIFSVESDKNWCDGLAAHLQANPGASKVNLHYADIGPTRQWGTPADTKHFLRWPGYPTSVWERPDFVHPDLVLIDGRFRLACILTTLVKITRPTRVLLDDYRDRKPYHAIEDIVRPTRLVGRMADFMLEPTSLPLGKLGMFLQSFMRPQ